MTKWILFGIAAVILWILMLTDITSIINTGEPAYDFIGTLFSK